MSAASTGRTHDCTRPVCIYLKSTLAKREPSTHVTMVAPSPDWFTGVAGLMLLRKGQWVAGLTVPLWAWDAGTDSGATFTAKNQDTQPRESVRLIAAPHFLAAGGLRAVGSVSFVRLP